MNRKRGVRRIGVLLGGQSKERAGSLVTGKTVIEGLSRLGYEVLAIDPAEEDLIQKLQNIDCAFVALHGEGGEDGTFQGFLETLNIPYTGSGVLASAIGMNKVIFKKLLLAEEMPTPPFMLISDANIAASNAETLGSLQFPIVVKPVMGGGSLGITVCRAFQDLEKAIKISCDAFDRIFLESYITGRFLTVGLLGRENAPEVLGIMEVEFPGEIYDYSAKHTVGAARFIVPATVSDRVKAKVEHLARRCYIVTGCNGPCRVDMLITAGDKIYILEINTIPGLSPNGNLTVISAASGISYEILLERILDSAFTRVGRH